MIWRNLRFEKSPAFEWVTDCKTDSRNSLRAYCLVIRFVLLMIPTITEMSNQ